MEDELRKSAEEFRKSHGIGDRGTTSNNHPLVDALREYFGNAQLLADDKNQAFTQLYLGKFRNIFTDETKDFALAYEYALHPLDEIQEELQIMGITEPVKVNKTIKEEGLNKEVSEYEQKPINFEVTILKNFIDEWLRKRVPANRLRVKEFIELFNKNNIGQELINPRSTQPQEPATRGRLF